MKKDKLDELEKYLTDALLKKSLLSQVKIIYPDDYSLSTEVKIDKDKMDKITLRLQKSVILFPKFNKKAIEEKSIEVINSLILTGNLCMYISKESGCDTGHTGCKDYSDLKKYVVVLRKNFVQLSQGFLDDLTPIIRVTIRSGGGVMGKVKETPVSKRKVTNSINEIEV